MENPYVSIVILTMECPNKLCDSLKNQTYQNFEIIIADAPGIVIAMNEALERAKGQIFVRIDDDVEIPPNWLEELIKPFENENVVGVTGPTFVPKERRCNRDSIKHAENPNWFLRWLFDGRPYDVAKIYKCGSVGYGSNYEEKAIYPMWPHEVDHLEGTNWAMRTNLIRMWGGFDESYDGVCEWFDTDIEQKILQFNKNYRLVYNPKAWLNHMLGKGNHFPDRFSMVSRIENWLRFHFRHSKFHYKKIIWFLMMIGYALCQKSR